jgi:tripeptide aminopeptidase
MDTIPGFSGTNVKPNVIYNYDGENIKLNNITLDTNTFSYLPSLKGKTLITTDGTTVLGADDKAGIANIMGMLWYYVNNPDVKHCEINVSFSPDEEIGGAMDQFDIKGFNSDFAYTVDGLRFNEIEYENFNAASAKVEIKGFDIHPGDAKDKMINASRVAMEFDSMLSEFDRPEHTEGYEGFNHLTDMSGEVGYAKLSYILRNHDKEKLESQKNDFINIKDFLNKKYGNIVTLTITDSYKNMKEKIMKDNRCVTRAIEAIKKLGFNPVSKPIRGGTDGARLTELGLNTPNLGTGGYNCHGPYEMACLEEMENVSKILIEISKTE